MKRTAALCVAALGLAGCGATFSAVALGRSSSPPAAVYACATEQVKAVGFERKNYDEAALRLVATRKDPDVTRSDTQFRGAYDELQVRVLRDEAGDETQLRVTAASFIEYFDRTGLRRVDREASAGALRAAETVVDACAPEEEEDAGA